MLLATILNYAHLMYIKYKYVYDIDYNIITSINLFFDKCTLHIFWVNDLMKI